MLKIYAERYAGLCVMTDFKHNENVLMYVIKTTDHWIHLKCIQQF